MRDDKQNAKNLFLDLGDFKKYTSATIPFHDPTFKVIETSYIKN